MWFVGKLPIISVRALFAGTEFKIGNPIPEIRQGRWDLNQRTMDWVSQGSAPVTDGPAVVVLSAERGV